MITEEEIIDCLLRPENIAHYPTKLTSLPYAEAKIMLSGQAANQVAEGLQIMATLTFDKIASINRHKPFLDAFAYNHLSRARIAYSFHRLSRIQQALSEVQFSVSADLDAAQTSLAEAKVRVSVLRQAIGAGLDYLKKHQEIGVSVDPVDTSPRDRFSRRLSQLELLHANELLVTQQLRLTTDRILDSYERVKEFLDVAYPAWLQQIQSAINQVGEIYE